jgi:hypothetical protein
MLPVESKINEAAYIKPELGITTLNGEWEEDLFCAPVKPVSAQILFQNDVRLCFYIS